MQDRILKIECPDCGYEYTAQMKRVPSECPKCGSRNIKGKVVG